MQKELVYTAWLLHLEPMMTSSKADPEMIIFLVLYFKPDLPFISQVFKRLRLSLELIMDYNLYKPKYKEKGS